MKQLLILLSFVFVICSCAGTAKVPDRLWCADEGNSGYCEWSISKGSMVFEGEKWHQFRQNRFSVSPEGFGAYQIFVEKTCERFDEWCTKEMKEEIQRMKSLKKSLIDHLNMELR